MKQTIDAAADERAPSEPTSLAVCERIVKDVFANYVQPTIRDRIYSLSLEVDDPEEVRRLEIIDPDTPQMELRVTRGKTHRMYDVIDGRVVEFLGEGSEASHRELESYEDQALSADLRGYDTPSSLTINLR